MPAELSEKIANAVAEAARLGYFESPAAAAVGLPFTQEPKYTVNGHAIVNRSTGNEIPADEPVFVFRARDPKAVPALFGYEAIITDPGHRAAVFARINQFRKFTNEHPERMKEPDTAVSSGQ